MCKSYSIMVTFVSVHCNDKLLGFIELPNSNSPAQCVVLYTAYLLYSLQPCYSRQLSTKLFRATNSLPLYKSFIDPVLNALRRASMKRWRARLPAYIPLPIVSTEGNDCKINTNVSAFLATVSNSWRDIAGSNIMKEG